LKEEEVTAVANKDQKATNYRTAFQVKNVLASDWLKEWFRALSSKINLR